MLPLRSIGLALLLLRSGLLPLVWSRLLPLPSVLQKKSKSLWRLLGIFGPGTWLLVMGTQLVTGVEGVGSSVFPLLVTNLNHTSSAASRCSRICSIRFDIGVGGIIGRASFLVNSSGLGFRLGACTGLGAVCRRTHGSEGMVFGVAGGGILSRLTRRRNEFPFLVGLSMVGVTSAAVEY